MFWERGIIISIFHGGIELANSFESHVQHTFDSYCKKVLKNAAIDIRREYNRLNKQEISLSSLKDEVANKLFYYEKYLIESDFFLVSGMPVYVNDTEIAEAIKELKAARRKVILLYYYVGLNYKEISDLLGIAIGSVSYHRKRAVEDLRNKLLGKKEYE